MLNRNDYSTRLYFVPDFKGNVPIVPQLRMMFTVGGVTQW
jgi:hypothetical protein